MTNINMHCSSCILSITCYITIHLKQVNPSWQCYSQHWVCHRQHQVPHLDFVMVSTYHRFQSNQVQHAVELLKFKVVLMMCG